MDETPVRIADLANEFEAQRLAEILNEKEVPHVIHSFYDLVYDGLFQTQKGWGCVEADERHRDVVIAELEHLRMVTNEAEDIEEDLLEEE